jgi:hypothetical protein
VVSLASITRSNSEQRKLAKTAVIYEDSSGVTSCPKCAGASGLRFGEGNWLTDSMWCVYCGWRPGSRLSSE